MPPIYLATLKAAFEEADEGADRQAGLQNFSLLAQKIAAMYPGFNLSGPAINDIVRGGIAYALELAPSRLEFLPWGLGHFTGKLPPPDAEQLVDQLEGVGAGHGGGEGEEEEEGWGALFMYLAGMKVRRERERIGWGGGGGEECMKFRVCLL
jgi:hypothetical protein